MRQVPSLVHILDEDPDLALGLHGPRRASARRRATAPVMELSPGQADLIDAYGSVSGWFGLLVLDGLILQHARVLERSTTQMLGRGDLFCPWQIEQNSAVLRSTVSYEVIAASRVALLDDAFGERVRPWPEIASALIGRAQALTVTRGLAGYPRVDIRIVALLWELAERSGVAVADETVVLPIPLDAQAIARIVGCEPESVSSALGLLRRDGLIASDSAGWILNGSLPLQIEFLLARGLRRPFAVVPGGSRRGQRGFRTSSTG